MAVVASVAVWATTSRSQPAAPPLGPPARSGPPAPPPFKPEPARILTLDLPPAQRKAVASIDAAWRKEKEALLAAMDEAARPAQDGGRSLGQLRAGLQEYAELSRRYDAARRRHWQVALAVLSPKQRSEVVAP